MKDDIFLRVKNFTLNLIWGQICLHMVFYEEFNFFSDIFFLIFFLRSFSLWVQRK